MRSYAALLVLLFVAFACAQNTNLSSFNTFGIDMIVIDSPSWLTKIQKSHGQHELLVFGETTQRIVVGSETGTPFSAYAVLPYWESNPFEMQDLETFPFYNATTNTSVPWTIGVTDYTQDQGGKFFGFNSPYLPLIYIKPSGANWIQETQDPITNVNWDGMMFAAVKVDYRNYSDVQAYYAGFTSFYDCTNQIMLTSFGVFRVHLDIATPTSGLLNNARFTFNPNTDTGIFYGGLFTFFSAAVKPIVHLLPNYIYNGQNVTLVAVADPNTRAVYTGFFNPASASGFTSLFNFTVGTRFSDLVSAVLSYQYGKLYVGVSLSGFNNTGSIVVIDLNMGVATSYPLPEFANNPKALSLDDQNSILYIGLNGDSEVLRFDLSTNTVTGYQRLPEWLHRAWDATEFPDHIYFITNEEHSKVFRINKADFCPSRCPYNGYCSKGSCVCANGFTMQDGGCTLTQLVHETTIYKKAHGGEVALGILFMFSFIAAAAGWFLWYRGRRGTYQSV